MKKFKKLLAFTLAEVLITLSILGVVAAITVPSLIQRNEERSTVTKVLKTYSMLSEAFEQTQIEYGRIGQVSYADFVDEMYKRMNVKEEFTYASFEGPYGFSNLYGLAWTSTATKHIRLADGIVIAEGNRNFSPTESDGSYNKCDKEQCTWFFVDINGEKKPPNTWGKDVFTFGLWGDGIKGRRYDKYSPTTLKLCNPFQYSDIWNGANCVDWILRHKNMHYLHCKKLNEDDTTCN